MKFRRPMSEANTTYTFSFKVHRKLRQQFDWAFIEWNRDRMLFEHPALQKTSRMRSFRYNHSDIQERPETNCTR